MPFNKSACLVRKVYCGDGKVPKDTAEIKYSRKGTQYECLKKGYGIAHWERHNKGLSKTSLQQIMYIGPKYETNFKRLKVYSIISLLKKTSEMSAAEKKSFIATGCKRENGSVDQKAFNAVVLFLYTKDQGDLPACKIVREWLLLKVVSPQNWSLC